MRPAPRDGRRRNDRPVTSDLSPMTCFRTPYCLFPVGCCLRAVAYFAYFTYFAQIAYLAGSIHLLTRSHPANTVAIRTAHPANTDRLPPSRREGGTWPRQTKTAATRCRQRDYRQTGGGRKLVGGLGPGRCRPAPAAGTIAGPAPRRAGGPGAVGAAPFSPEPARLRWGDLTRTKAESLNAPGTFSARRAARTLRQPANIFGLRKLQALPIIGL